MIKQGISQIKLSMKAWTKYYKKFQHFISFWPVYFDAVGSLSGPPIQGPSVEGHLVDRLLPRLLPHLQLRQINRLKVILKTSSLNAIVPNPGPLYLVRSGTSHSWKKCFNSNYTSLTELGPTVCQPFAYFSSRVGPLHSTRCQLFTYPCTCRLLGTVWDLLWSLFY